MVSTASMLTPRWLTGLLGAVMAAQALLGLLLPGEYRDPAWIAATWFGNDWFTLIVAVPAIAAAPRLAQRGSPRALLVWLATLGYAIYNYAFYLFGAALNAFLPLYAAAFVLAAVTMILMLAAIDAGAIADDFRPQTPVRLVGGYLVCVAVGLACVWLGMWGAYVFAGRPTPVEPEAFKIVAALDLCLMVPALAAGGSLLWRRRPWGYVLAPIAAGQGSLYLIVLTVNSMVAIRRGLAVTPGELPLWGPLALFTTLAAVLLLINVRDSRTGASDV